MSDNFRIVIDTREQAPLVFTEQNTIVQKLDTGDYSIENHQNAVAVERKSLADLVQCIVKDRDRFKSQLERLSKIQHRLVVVEAPFTQLAYGVYRSKASPSSVVGSMLSFQVKYDVPFIFLDNKLLCSAYVQRYLQHVNRNL